MKAKPSKQIRQAVLNVSKSLPTLSDGLDMLKSICPELAYAVEGIWCGREGREAILIPAWDLKLVVDWYEGRLENTYIS